jgi:hypothetical protein
VTDKLVFMHIPKNGGTSLRSLLSSWYDAELRCPYREGQDYLQNFDEEQLQRYSFFTGHLPLYVVQRFFPKSMTKFTVLRDPVERAYSLYAYWRDFKLPDEDATADAEASDEVATAGAEASDTVTTAQAESSQATEANEAAGSQGEPPAVAEAEVKADANSDSEAQPEQRPFPSLYPNEYAGPMIAKKLDFGSFLFSNHPYVRKALTNPQTRFLCNARIYDHVESMNARDVIDTVVREARDWNITVEVLEQPDRMTASIGRIAASLGVSDEPELPHENRSERRGLDDLDRTLVADFLKMISPLDFLLYEHFRHDH